jgi:hypothetical protein
MSDIDSLADTIKPKSDQLNADDLLTGPMNVTITGVRRGAVDQPVILDIDGGNQPFKPCKTMRRVLITAWGDDGKAWVGRSMTLFCDPTVKWGGVAIGGIRISHVSHIKASINMMLTATRGKRSNHTVHPLEVAAPIDENAITMFFALDDQEQRNTAWAKLSPETQTEINKRANEAQ